MHNQEIRKTGKGVLIGNEEFTKINNVIELTGSENIVLQGINASNINIEQKIDAKQLVEQIEVLKTICHNFKQLADVYFKYPQYRIENAIVGSNTFKDNEKIIVGSGNTYNENKYYLGRETPEPNTVNFDRGAKADNIFGREKELEEIHKLFDVKDVVVVTGIAGSGKSSLARKYVHHPELSTKYKKIAYVTINNDLLQDITTALNTFLKIPLQNYPTAEEQFEHLKTTLVQLKPVNLLVLDINKVEPITKSVVKEIENKITKIKTENWKILILTKTQPENRKYIVSYPLDKLDNKAAVQLFETYSEICNSSETDLEKLFTQLHYHAFLIEQTATAAYNANKTNISQVLDMLKEDTYNNATFRRQKIDTILHTEGKQLSKDEIDIYNYTLQMYDISTLNEVQKTLLTHFLLLPQGDIPANIIETLFNGILPDDHDPITELNDLSKLGWLMRSRTNDGFAYKMHGIFSDILKTQIPPSVEKCSVYFYNIKSLWDYNETNFIEFYTFIKYSISKSGSLSTENFMLQVNLSQKERYLGKLPEAITTLQNIINALEPKKELIEILNIWHSVPVLETVYGLLAEIYETTGQYAETLEYYTKLVNSYELKYEANPKSENLKNGLAISYSKLGSIYQSLGDFDKALQFFNFYNQYSKELYEANPKSENLKNGLAISYEKLGGIYLSLNNETEAKNNYVLCKNFFESLVNENPQNINNQTNYAEIIAISAIFDLHQYQTNQQAMHELQKAINIWKLLYKQTNRVYYQKKLDLVLQYINKTRDYKTTIVNLTKE